MDADTPRRQAPGYAEREVSWALEHAAASDASSRRVVRRMLGDALLRHQIVSDGILDPKHRAEFESIFADDTAAIRDALAKIDDADEALGTSTAEHARGPTWNADRLDDFTRLTWRGARLRPVREVDPRAWLMTIDLGQRTRCDRDEIPPTGSTVILRSEDGGPHWLAATLSQDAIDALAEGAAGARNAIRSSRGPIRILAFASGTRQEREVSSSWKVGQEAIPDAFL